METIYKINDRVKHIKENLVGTVDRIQQVGEYNLVYFRWDHPIDQDCIINAHVIKTDRHNDIIVMS